MGSYSQKSDRFVSHTTGKSYAFIRDRDGISKRQALAQLQTDDLAAERAAAERNGAPLTLRQNLFGVKQPDTRTLAERVLEDTVHIKQPGDSEANPFERALADVNATVARTRFEKAQKKHRAEKLAEQAVLWEQRRQAKLEREAHLNSEPVQDAIIDAQTSLNLLQFRGDVPQEWIDQAKQRLEIAKTGNTDAYWAATKAFEAERDAIIKDKAGKLEAAAKALKEEAKKIKADEPEPAAEVAESV